MKNIGNYFHLENYIEHNPELNDEFENLRINDGFMSSQYKNTIGY